MIRVKCKKYYGYRIGTTFIDVKNTCDRELRDRLFEMMCEERDLLKVVGTYPHDFCMVEVTVRLRKESEQ